MKNGLYIMGINAAKATGKDFFFNTFKETFGEDYNIIRISFADQLKMDYIDENFEKLSNIILEYFPDKVSDIRDIKFMSYTEIFEFIDILKNIPETPVRTDLQKIGSEKKVTHGTDYWVNKAFEYMYEEFEKVKNNGKDTIMVITDVRFLDEAIRIMEEGGIVISFKNYQQLIQNINNISPAVTHISEKLSYLATDIGLVYSLVPNYLNGQNLYTNKNNLIEIGTDIIRLLENKRDLTQDEINKLKKVNEEWTELLSGIDNLFNVPEEVDITLEIYINIVNRIMKKSIGILY